jgi:hypothetical protein
MFSARESGQPGRLFSGGLLITLVCLCLGVLLAACGTKGISTTTGAGSTPTKVVVQQCGTVHTTPRGTVTDTTTAKTAENCFAQAYKQCQPATLGFNLLSLDSGVNRTFTVKSTNGQCVITDAAQHYIVPKKLSPVQSYTCTGLTQQTDGLHFSSCGQDGDLLVPATSNPIQQ